MKPATIRALLRAHLAGDGTANDSTTDELYRSIANGTASEEMRAAYRLQLVSAQNESLRAAEISTQTNWVDTVPAEANGQGLMF